MSFHTDQQTTPSGGYCNPKDTCPKVYPSFIKLLLLNVKSQTKPSTVVQGDFNTLLSPTDNHHDKKINKEIFYLNYTI